jgi:hypothetical protein
MNIAAIVLISIDPSFVNGSSILLSNNYVAILGVVFATIWTNRQNWNKHAISNGPSSDDRMEHSSFDPSSRRLVSTIRFDFAPYSSSGEVESRFDGERAIGMEFTREVEEKAGP